MDYKEYLKTAHFLNLKKATLKKWGNKCALCSNPNDLHVHHNCYSWFKENENDVIPLCKRCHDKFHDLELHPAAKFKDDPESLIKEAKKIVDSWGRDG